MDTIANEMKRGLDVINNGFQIRADIWYSDVLFSWRWWFGVGVSFFCWILWIFLHDRKNVHRLLYAGMFVMLVSVSFDATGMQLKLWHYIYPIFPFIPAYLPYDLALMPVSIMLVIQYKPEINPFIKATLFASFATLIGEPLFEITDIYKPLHWKSIYSWPIYFLIYLSAHGLTTRSNMAPLNNKTTKKAR